jgi:hypothetical protein
VSGEPLAFPPPKLVQTRERKVQRNTCPGYFTITQVKVRSRHFQTLFMVLYISGYRFDYAHYEPFTGDDETQSEYTGQIMAKSAEPIVQQGI